MKAWGGSVFGKQRLPTDPIGTATVTLTNLVVDSAIEIQDQALTTSFANRTATGTTEAFTLQVYAAGSALNSLRIKVRKGTTGSSKAYIPWETLLTATVGSTSIYVAQVADE
jgi:hypothetical protein